MKTRSDYRRENFAALVAKYGQAGVANRIRKDRNQVYQWTLDPADKAARNISDRSAAAIEEAFGLPRGWLDHEHPPLTDSRLPPEPETPSQVLGLDLSKLAAAQKFLEDLFRAEGVRFIASEQTMLLAAVYQELMTASEPNVVDMAARFGRKVRGQDGRQSEVGGAVTDDRGGVGEGGEETRIAHRRRAKG